MDLLLLALLVAVGSILGVRLLDRTLFLVITALVMGAHRGRRRCSRCTVAGHLRGTWLSGIASWRCSGAVRLVVAPDHDAPFP